MVLICDDHPLMSQGLRALLKPNFVAVGVVNDGREVMTEIERTKPDILLLDLSMPHRNGLELIPEIARAFPALKVLVVTMHVDRAHGYLPAFPRVARLLERPGHPEDILGSGEGGPEERSVQHATWWDQWAVRLTRAESPSR